VELPAVAGDALRRPALMAGNVGLLKHSSNVPQTALYLEDVAARAASRPTSFQTLLIGSAR
jgi:succinate-semialdehyde dehydrogenase/glutarate-semialdehyde dehydrogenase